MKRVDSGLSHEPGLMMGVDWVLSPVQKVLKKVESGLSLSSSMSHKSVLSFQAIVMKRVDSGLFFSKAEVMRRVDQGLFPVPKVIKRVHSGLSTEQIVKKRIDSGLFLRRQ